jgi:hypothetical protein
MRRSGRTDPSEVLRKEVYMELKIAPEEDAVAESRRKEGGAERFTWNKHFC